MPSTLTSTATSRYQAQAKRPRSETHQLDRYAGEIKTNDSAKKQTFADLLAEASKQR